MNEAHMKQLVAELIEANSAALGLIVAAMARQMDAERLAAELKAQIAAAAKTGAVPKLAIRLATAALAAADAEVLLRCQETEPPVAH